MFFFCYLSSPPHLHYGCSLGALRQQGLRILKHLEDGLMCSQTEEQCHRHVFVSLAHIPSLGLRINSKVQTAAHADPPVSRNVVECHGWVGNINTGEAGIPQNLPLSFSPGNQYYLETLSTPLGPCGGISTSGATGSFAHVSGTKVFIAPGAMPTETPAGHGTGLQKAMCGPQVVEDTSQHVKGKYAWCPVLCLRWHPWWDGAHSKMVRVPVGAGLSSGRACSF